MNRHTIKDLQAAQKAYDNARGRMNEIKEEIDEREFAPKRKALIGKCFKYRNSYSCPQKASDYWWLWTRVKSVDGGMLNAVDVQLDSHGEIRIRRNALMSLDGTMMGGYIPVTTRQFNTAVRKILSRARTMCA